MTLRLLGSRHPEITCAALALAHAVLTPALTLEDELSPIVESLRVQKDALHPAPTTAGAQNDALVQKAMDEAHLTKLQDEAHLTKLQDEAHLTKLQALPWLHMLLHAPTTTPEGRAGTLRLIAALIRLESAGAQDGASSDRPRRRTERPPRAVLADRRDKAPAGRSGAVVSVAEAVVREGVVLSCLFHLLGHQTIPVDYVPENTHPTSQGASIEVRAAAVDTLCALLADATVGSETEELLDRCLAPQVDCH